MAPKETVRARQLTLVGGASVGDFQQAFRVHLSEKLKRNRLVLRLLEALDREEELSILDVAQLLTKNCPYVSASASTWESYAENISEWLDAADLAIYDKKIKRIQHYESGTQVRERHFSRSYRRSGIAVIPVQYRPVESLAKAFSIARSREGKMDWPAMKPTTRQKAFGS